MRRELLTSSLDLDLLELRLLEDLLRRRRRSLALRALDLETDMSGLAPALGLVTMTLGVQNRAAESSTKIRGRDETGGRCGLRFARCGTAVVGRSACGEVVASAATM